MALHLRCRAVFMHRASRSICCSREKPISRYVFVWKLHFHSIHTLNLLKVMRHLCVCRHLNVRSIKCAFYTLRKHNLDKSGLLFTLLSLLWNVLQFLFFTYRHLHLPRHRAWTWYFVPAWPTVAKFYPWKLMLHHLLQRGLYPNAAHQHNLKTNKMCRTRPWLLTMAQEPWMTHGK